MADRFTVRAVVCFLGAFALLALTGLIWLTDHGVDATIIAGLAGTALGSLGTLLATTKAGPSEEDLRQLAAVAAPPAPIQADLTVHGD